MSLLLGISLALTVLFVCALFVSKKMGKKQMERISFALTIISVLANILIPLFDQPTQQPAIQNNINSEYSTIVQGDVNIQYNNITEKEEKEETTSELTPDLYSSPSPSPSLATNYHIADMYNADQLQGVTVPNDDSWFDSYISGIIYQKDGHNILIIDNPVPNENNKLGEFRSGTTVVAMAKQGEYLLVVDNNKTVGWINSKYFRSE